MILLQGPRFKPPCVEFWQYLAPNEDRSSGLKQKGNFLDSLLCDTCTTIVQIVKEMTCNLLYISIVQGI